LERDGWRRSSGQRDEQLAFLRDSVFDGTSHDTAALP
jgi:hypothetical protein